MERPNIILIEAQGLAAGVCGFESGVASTPNLDALAARSAVFTRCYTPTAQAAPSQAALLTGQYPHVNGVTTNGMLPSRRAEAFPERLRRGGYVCGVVGQWHLTAKSMAQAAGVAKTGGAAAPQPPSRPGLGMTDYEALADPGCTGTNCTGWVGGERVTITEYLTDWEAAQALRFIEENAKGPFFLYLAFRAPDAPQAYPPGDEAAYPAAELRMPPRVNLAAGWPRGLTQSGLVSRFQSTTDTMLREARSKYLAALTRLDRSIGGLLDSLQKLGIADKTIVVFTSNHGMAFGEHGLHGSGAAFFDELVRVPLIIHLPTARPITRENAASRPAHAAKSRIERVVSLVDLAPTLCDLAGVGAPVLADGRSMLGLLRDRHADAWPDEAFLEFHKQSGPGMPEKEIKARGIVTPYYKYIDYLDEPTDILHDLKRDPAEDQNYAPPPPPKWSQYTGVQNVLKARLNQWRKATRDPAPVN